MENIFILNNIPSEILDGYAEVFAAYDFSKEKERGRRFFESLLLNETQHLLDQIPGNPTVSSLFRLKQGRGTPHVDAPPRNAMLQIPINSVKTGKTFSVKQGCMDRLETFTPEIPYTHLYKPNVVRDYWLYDPDLFDHYDYSTPYLQNATLPHGGGIEADETLYMWSLNFNDYSFDELKVLLKDWE